MPPINDIRKFNTFIAFFVAMFSFVITNKRLNSLCYNKLQIATCEANQNIEPTYKLGKLNI